MVREFGVSPAPEKLLARNGGTAVGDGLRMAPALGAAPSGGMNNIYGHLHNRDAMQSTKHLAAAGHRRSRRGRHRHRRRGPAVHRRGARRHLDFQRHRPPARPARHHDHLRPGDLGGPARPQSRAAAQSAGGRGRRHLASCRHARRAGREDRLAPERLNEVGRRIQRSGRAGTLQTLAPPRRSTATRPGRSRPRRSTRCRSAPRSPTPWAASWWTATLACSI